MDKELRDLERRVASGDPEAAERLEAMRERIRTRYPFLLNFSGGHVYEYLWLSPYGFPDKYDLGAILPRDGILKSITIQTDRIVAQQYQLAILEGDAIPANTIAKATLKPGAQRVCLQGLKVEDVKIPRLMPFGVRLHRSSGDQRSAFNAIHVALEIWM